MIVNPARPISTDTKSSLDRRAIFVYVDNETAPIDLLQQQQLYRFGELKCIYIDTSAQKKTDSGCLITCNSGQNISVQSGTQGYYPIFDQKISNLKISSDSLTNIVLFDFAIPGASWQTGASAVSNNNGVISSANASIVAEGTYAAALNGALVGDVALVIANCFDQNSVLAVTGGNVLLQQNYAPSGGGGGGGTFCVVSYTVSETDVNNGYIEFSQSGVTTNCAIGVLYVRGFTDFTLGALNYPTAVASNLVCEALPMSFDPNDLAIFLAGPNFAGDGLAIFGNVPTDYDFFESDILGVNLIACFRKLSIAAILAPVIDAVCYGADAFWVTLMIKGTT